MAILDVFPTVPGHALLIPKGEYTTLDEMPPSVAGAFMADLPRLVKAVTVRGQARQCGGGMHVEVGCCVPVRDAGDAGDAGVGWMAWKEHDTAVVVSHVVAPYCSTQPQPFRPMSLLAGTLLHPVGWGTRRYRPLRGATG